MSAQTGISEQNAPFTRRAEDSRAEQVHIVMPADANGVGRLFGGRLMEWVDVVAGVVARRHSGRDVTTAAIERLDFVGPAFVNDTVVLRGRITFTGRTSMEVCVDTFVEALGGAEKHVNRALLTLVALGGDGRPTAVPQLLPENDAERAAFEAGRRRHAARRAQAGE